MGTPSVANMQNNTISLRSNARRASQGMPQIPTNSTTNLFPHAARAKTGIKV
jgi:hypothetical protein